MPSESHAGNYSQVADDRHLARLTVPQSRALRRTACMEKRRYISRGDAIGGARRDRRKGNGGLSAYECAFCHAALGVRYWHRGHLGSLTREQHERLMARAVDVLRLAGEL